MPLKAVYIEHNTGSKQNTSEAEWFRLQRILGTIDGETVSTRHIVDDDYYSRLTPNSLTLFEFTGTGNLSIICRPTHISSNSHNHFHSI